VVALVTRLVVVDGNRTPARDCLRGEAAKRIFAAERFYDGLGSMTRFQFTP